jgi:predicted nicotinamide N-methyase
VVANFASQVVITDGSEIALELIRYNIERNFSSRILPNSSKSCHISAQKLRWGQETKAMFHQFDIVLASDVVYPSPIFFI